VTAINSDLITGLIQSILDNNNIKACVEVRDVRVTDGFYSTYDDIYGLISRHPDDISVDKKKWLLREYELNADFKVGDVPFIYDEVVDWAVDWGLVKKDSNEPVDDKDELNDYELAEEQFEGLTLDELSEMYPEYYPYLIERINDVIKEADYYELEPYLSELFSIDYPEEELNEFDVLGYWTVYFKPAIWDEDVAWECGLFPFYYEDEGYLALGGCGMDLSPRLDAYQALVDGSIPSGSNFIRQPDYAKYVVGEKLFNKVMEKIKCPPVITIYCQEAA